MSVTGKEGSLLSTWVGNHGNRNKGLRNVTFLSIVGDTVIYKITQHVNFVYKTLSFRRETELQGALVLAKSRRLHWETVFYGHYHCDIIGRQSNRIR